MTQPSNEPSEFGGYSGPIQPPPHEWNNAERARLERKTDSTDPSDTEEAARLREGGVA
jgi:hypothetical protein